MRFSTPIPPHDLTYSDVFLVPSRSAITSRLDVDLAPGDGTGATLPIVSANMNSVTGPRLAATLARRGGLGVLPQDLSMDDMVAAIGAVKNASVTWDDAFDARDPRLAGVDLDALPTLDVLDPRDAFDALVEGGHEFARVAAGGTTSRKSALRGTLYAPALDDDGRLRVAVALGINGDVAAKAKALIEAGADVLVLDTAHGHQDGMLRALSAVAGVGVPIVAGNIVTP
ncbi:MAG: IMP dehydrogenase, partial [Pseudolysinimonas sp.]